VEKGGNSPIPCTTQLDLVYFGVVASCSPGI
jgi:hypothetical protein